MFQSMRESLQSWWMKLLLAAIILSFVSFYGWDAGGGCSRYLAARVDGDSITIRDFEMKTQSTIAQYRNFGLIQENISDEILFSVRKNVLEAMINQKLTAQEVRDFGLHASDKEVRESIYRQFGTTAENFDVDNYRKILRSRLGKSPAEFEESEADRLLAEYLNGFIEDTTIVTDIELRQTFETRNNKVNLEYVSIDPEKDSRVQNLVTAPSDSELRKHFTDHQSEYAEAEARKLEVGWVEMRDLLSPSETELQSILDQRFQDPSADVARGVRIHAAHILLKTTPQNEVEQKKKADAFYRDLKSGKDFESLARAESEDISRGEGGDLGYFGKGEMVPAFEEAALALQPGEISRPVKSEYGYHLIKLIDRIPPGEVTVERLRPELVFYWSRDANADSERNNRFWTKAQQILKGVKESHDPNKSLLKARDNTPELKVVATDFVKADEPIEGVPSGYVRTQISSQAQLLAKGELSAPIQGFGTQKAFIVRVADVKAPKTPEFETVRERVKKDFVQKKKKDAAEKYAAKMIADWANAKKSFSELAKKENLISMETGLFTKQSNGRIPGIGTDQDLMNQLFSPKLDQGSLVNRPVQLGGKIYLISIKERVRPNWELFDEQKDELARLAANDRKEQRQEAWLKFLRNHAKIVRYVMRPAGEQG